MKDIFQRVKEVTFQDLTDLVKKNLPNTITATGIILAAWLYVLLFWNEPSEHHLLILSLVVGICLSDLIDGWLARNWQMISSMGKALDVFRDKLFSCPLFFYFLKELWLSEKSGHWLALIKGLIILILVIEALFVTVWIIMIIGWIMGFIKKLKVNVNWAGKIKTDAYFIAIGWWFFVEWQQGLQTYLHGGLIFLLFIGFVSSVLSLPLYIQYYSDKNND